MTHRTLLDMFGEIDDSFIEEAANPEILLKQMRKRKWMTALSVRKWGTLAACMVVAVGLVFAVPYLNAATNAEDSEIQAAIDQNFTDVNAENEILDEQESIKAAIAASVSAENAQKAGDAEATASIAPSEMPQYATTTTAATTSKSRQEMTFTTTTSHAVSSSSASTVSGGTTAPTTATTAPPVNLFAVGNVTFKYLDGVLHSLMVEDGTVLTDLAIPEEMDGETITEIYAIFWSFAYSHREVKTITIPASVQRFGNIDALDKSIVIICPEGSPAEKFFTENGFTVQTTPA